VLAVVLALVSAIGYGGSDFAAGLASRTTSVIRVTLLASAAGLVVIAVVLPFAASHPPNAAGLAWGALAGLGGTAGAFALYLGFLGLAAVCVALIAVGGAGLPG
jgi:hypothetical protein